MYGNRNPVLSGRHMLRATTVTGVSHTRGIAIDTLGELAVQQIGKFVPSHVHGYGVPLVSYFAGDSTR